MTESHSNRTATIAASSAGVIAFLTFVLSVIAILIFKSLKNKQTHSNDYCSYTLHYVPTGPFMYTASETDFSNHTERQQTRNRGRLSNLKMQASNPIYERAVYETIPGESFKSLLSPGSIPSTPSADSATRYVFDHDIAPTIPPPRKGSVCLTPTLESVQKLDLSLQGAVIP